jgi:hypothetical protein
MAGAMTNNSTKRPFACEGPATTMTLSTHTTTKIDVEEDDGAIRESVCSPGSPAKRSRPSRLQVDEMGSGGVDPFPSLGTPLTATVIASAGRTLAHTLASTLEKELMEEEARSKSMRRSILAPLEVDDDAARVDPFLPSFAKTGHPVLGVCGAKPWEQDGYKGEEEEDKWDEGAMDEEGGIQDRSKFLSFDDEDEHVQLRRLATQLAAMGK